ncbi:cation:proton antiporter [Staphylococcus felis]|uniref:cation:proton antiporter n=1 Tax=Staphylococcus felis TaxID=46127 RepID=UPI000E28846C|nr:cation:proton antiporter [Staphylococcus felis]REH75985.1 cation:proton antiporter [Staphylococcus felis]REI00229.1 cation:proton antiporter [Staphylococcus felis]REI09065.1 cation:proton antiporter [Staphylococcus felis]REI11236.1 cation:proton antiporter [Staphylococcus felis]REI23864.1 cation:proton antiporter [Staphylococcus felis]
MAIFDFPILLISGLLLLLLFIGGYIANHFNVPDVIIFLLIGITLGLFIHGTPLIEFAAEVGIVLMFFMLGMEFPIRQLKTMAIRIYKPGLLDLGLSFFVTVGLLLLMHQPLPTALLLGGIVYATSSSITVKLLEKNKRMTTKDSNFLLGLLIFEDIVSPILVAIIASMYLSNAISIGNLSIVLLKIIALLIGAILLGHFVFKRLNQFIEKYISEDFFILFIVSIGLSYAGLALYLGLSEVFGAFLAGIMLAETQKPSALQQTVRNLRDLLMPVFFINFGMTIQLTNGIPMWETLCVLIVWSIIAKLIVGYVGGKQYGLRPQPAIRAGFSFTQRGEFSIIIAAFASAQIKTFSGIFILISAIIGVALFQYAPQIAKKLTKQKTIKNKTTPLP